MSIFIFIITFAVYLPLAGSLVYVWWKHGAGETKVAIARIVFLLGSLGLFFLMLTV
jgi:hypothetical protein